MERSERDGRAFVWVVTDGRAGNEVPAESLARAVAATAADAEARAGDAVLVKRIALRPGLAALPAPLWPLGAPRAAAADVAGWPFAGLVDRGAGLAPPWPALVIGAGRRAAPIVAEIRRRSGGRTRVVQILDPKLSPSLFDLVIVPAHDALAGANVLSLPAALGRLAAAGAEAAPSDPRLERLARPRVAALVGGPSGAARLGIADILALSDRLARAAEAGAGVAVITSRRTPELLAERLAARLEPIAAMVWRGEGANPYLAALATADAFVVTADSVNMTSEAAATGRPVYVAPVARLARKLRRFHAAMEAGGHTRPLAAAEAATIAAPADADEPWLPAPLDTLAAAVARVAPLLSGAR